MLANKKIISILLAFSLAFNAYASSKIDENKNRITEINKELNSNKKKIITNSNKISSAKKDEKKVETEIRVLNDKIYSLQKEYNSLERKYIALEKSIGRNEAEIRSSIKKIENSNDIIEEREEQYANRVKLLDQLRRSRLIKKTNLFETVFETKKKYDAKKLLELQEVNINSIKYYKKTVEESKHNVEKIKERNLNEAVNIKRARLELAKKKTELNNFKKQKDKKVSELKNLQRTLGQQNKKIQDKTSQLIREKNKLEAQISRIIAEENRKKLDKNQKPIVVIKGTGILAMPIKGPVVVTFNQEKVEGLKSNGIEIRGRLGQDVKAADTGTVIHSGNLGSLGGIVIINHSGIITVYGNLATRRVKKGQNVKKGEVIGTLGRDSSTKETNLYFETRSGVNLVDPLKYL
ncbi:murein hydrolase activator EnvC family protein [Oceanivirga miroungae]|uniref:Murein hydrolase activator EnvC n=1 Tax=Oceanivirga miroungae TaxID=1130046 RepID=A0A6I8M601_9FUSO|nr:peptidoglycan DD-metalloendopeptidase family protein [Oceanivirga miroungae]VWL84761.1 Murein hydrolase activator EnvC [Oceanivirga miroungae]